jgi:O-antigen ligase
MAAPLWILFLFGVSSAVRSLLPETENVERFFWLPADLIVVIWVLRRHGPALVMMERNMVLMLWAGLACISALWSLAPSMSLYHGAQLLMTILVGFMLCATWPGIRILQFLFLALFATQVLSLVMVAVKPSWGIAPWGEWKGAFTHKNELASMMALQIITALMLFLHGWRRMLTGAALALAVVLLVMSQSGTGLIALLVGLSLLPLAIAYSRSASLFSMCAGLLLIVGAALITGITLSSIDIVELALDGLGKDLTLTGRTVLWDFGIEAFLERPWLGHGYKGYWESPHTTALNLQYVMGQELWFFHNLFVEVAVAFGVVGPILLAAGLFAAFRRAVATFAAVRTSVSLWPLLFLLFLVPYVLAENPLFQNHSLLQLLFVVAMCARFDGSANGYPTGKDDTE